MSSELFHTSVTVNGSAAQFNFVSQTAATTETASREAEVTTLVSESE